jgi:prepilin-type N-terminal cleavage/methylation domain-containing protein
MKNKKGFTLIELLVVAVIIGILAAIALPQYQKIVEKSRFAQAFTLLGTLGRAQELYKLTYGDVSLTFDNFDVSIPNIVPADVVAGGMAHISGGGFRDEFFDYVIDSVNNDFWYGAIAIIRSNGKFAGSGFVYSNRQIYCVGSDKVCVNLYNATLYQSKNAGWDLYKMP